MRTFHTYEHSVGDDDSFGLPIFFFVLKNLMANYTFFCQSPQ